MPKPFDMVVSGLKAAAEPTRLRLLMLCACGELTVSELTQILGQSQPRVSRHLQVLCAAGLMIRFRERHWVYYRTPTQGDAATVVARLRDWLDPSDQRIELDRSRLEEVRAARASRAAELFQDARDRLGLLAEGGPDRAALGTAITGLVSGESIGDLLDIGTGSGQMLQLLAAHANSAVGIDISADALQLARSKLHSAGLNAVMVRQGDMYRLRYPDASFDTVVLDQVLAAAEHPALALLEAARLLRDGGQMLLVDVLATTEYAAAGLIGDVLRDWLRQANLRPVATEEFSGERVNYLVWVAQRADDADENLAA